MKILLIFISFFFLGNIYAIHVAGGQITYKAISGSPNTYLVTLTAYRDCGGPILGITQSISIDNDCGETNPILVVTEQEIREISQVCPSELLNTECNNGVIDGFQKYTYSGIVVFPATCDAWTLSWQSCNRNASVNLSNTNNNCFYINTKIYSQSNSNNSSPIVTNLYQIPYLCANQSIDLSTYIVDPDSDSLTFQFTNALDLNASTFSYTSGYSATQPIPGINLDISTGQLSFNHNMVGNYVLTILVTQYSNGILVGTMMHDFQIVLENCANAPPSMTGIQNFNNFGTNAANNNGVISACQGDQFCFDIVASDPDMNDSIILISDIDSIIPGATLTQTGSNPVTGTICWNYQPTYYSSSFNIRAQDNVCPIPGVSSQTFTFNLPTPINLVGDSLIFCDTNGLSPVSGASNALLEWYDLNGNLLDIGVDISCNPCLTPDFLFLTDTTVVVSSIGTCTVSDTLEIAFDYLPNNYLIDSILVCQGQTFTLQSPFPGLVNIWNDSLYQDSINVNFSAPEYVSLEINSYGQCVALDSTYIMTYLPNPTISDIGWAMQSNTFSSYQWLLNNSDILGANSQNYVPTVNGDYRVFVIDSIGCADTSDVFTITSAGLEEQNSSISIYKLNNQIIINQAPINSIAEVYNIEGKLIERREVSGQVVMINLPLAKQIYIIKLLNGSGKVLAVKKL